MKKRYSKHDDNSELIKAYCNDNQDALGWFLEKNHYTLQSSTGFPKYSEITEQAIFKTTVLLLEKRNEKVCANQAVALKYIGGIVKYKALEEYRKIYKNIIPPIPAIKNGDISISYWCKCLATLEENLDLLEKSIERLPPLECAVAKCLWKGIKQSSTIYVYINQQSQNDEELAKALEKEKVLKSKSPCDFSNLLTLSREKIIKELDLETQFIHYKKKEWVLIEAIEDRLRTIKNRLVRKDIGKIKREFLNLCNETCKKTKIFN